MTTLARLFPTSPRAASLLPTRSRLACCASLSHVPLASLPHTLSTQLSTSILSTLPPQVYSLATLDAATAGTLKTVLSPLFSLLSLLFIVRIVMTWYPEIDGKKFPWSIAYEPTEPLLGVTRNVVPPLSGVDISPIIWVGVISFLNEIILGPQGLLSLIQREGGI